MLICFTLSINLWGQNENDFKFGIEISTDNDAFVIWENFDRYYTYGAGFQFYFKSKRLLGLENLFKTKSDYFFKAGFRTEGYTPTKQLVSELAFEADTLSFERPFAGLLFGTFQASYLFENGFVKTDLILGIMGPSALSKEIQDWIHENITEDDLIDGWEFQIPDQAIININLSAATQLLNNKSWYDIYVAGEARLGNLYIDATPTIGLRIGKFNSLSNSSAFGNFLLAPKGSKEIFLKSTFSATAVGFDATAQGNIFTNDFTYAVEDLSHFYTSMTHGLFYSGNRFSASFDHVFTFGKVNQHVRHIYGRFAFNYRF